MPNYFPRGQFDVDNVVKSQPSAKNSSSMMNENINISNFPTNMADQINAQSSFAEAKALHENYLKKAQYVQ